MRNPLSMQFFLLMIFYCPLAFSVVHVSGYYKANGTYVAPYYRSSPNQTRSDNWSTKGNLNPYTGKEGSKSLMSNQESPEQSGRMKFRSKSLMSNEEKLIKTNNKFNNQDIYGNHDLTGSKIYKWTDKNHITHYSDKPPP